MFRSFTASVVDIDLLYCEGAEVAEVYSHFHLAIETGSESQQSLRSIEHETLQNSGCRLGQLL